MAAKFVNFFMIIAVYLAFKNTKFKTMNICLDYLSFKKIRLKKSRLTKRKGGLINLIAFKN